MKCILCLVMTFSRVKVMAKWYHENGIKTPLRVYHFKNYAYTFIFLDALSILFRRV